MANPRVGLINCLIYLSYQICYLQARIRLSENVKVQSSQIAVANSLIFNQEEIDGLPTCYISSKTLLICLSSEALLQVQHVLLLK